MDPNGFNPSGSANPKANLIVNYLPQSLTDQELFKMFNVIGPIKSCRIMKDLKTGYSYGYGFVEFHDPDDASKAILQLNNLQLQHKRIKVSFARPAGDDIKETNLSYSLDKLEELFSPFGAIVQKNLLKDKVTGQPRGVGFIRFDKKKEADDAISVMNGHIPDGGSQPLIVRIAEEHGKMKAAYYAGFNAALRGGRGRSTPTVRPFNSQYGRGNFNSSMLRGNKLSQDRIYNRFNPIGGGNLTSRPYNFTTSSFHDVFY